MDNGGIGSMGRPSRDYDPDALLEGEEFGNDSEPFGDIAGEDRFGLDAEDQDLGNLQTSHGAMTVRNLLRQLESFLQNLPPEKKFQYKSGLESLRKDLFLLRNNSIAPHRLVENFYSIQGQAMGADSMGQEFGMDESEAGDFAAQLRTAKSQVEKNDKLDEPTKQALLDKLQGVDNIRSISGDQAQEKLDALQEEIQNYAVNSPAAMRLNAELGLEDPAVVQVMLERHGIDGSAKSLGPAKLENLLNDPLIAEAVAAEKEAFDTANQALMEMIPKQTKAAHEANQMTDQKDDSAILDTDVSSFKWLYETSRMESKECKDVLAAANALAKKKAQILSALAGKEVSLDPKQPGMLKLPDGVHFNGVNNTSRGPAIEWPSIELVEFHADLEGDGQTQFPDWMKQAHYPYRSIDEGGWNPILMIFIPLTPIGAAVGAGIGAGVGHTGLFTYEPENPY